METKNKLPHGGQILANALVRQGVDIAFGVPGESFLPLLDGLVDHSNDFRFITCRQEGGAAYMAEAYAKLTGKPGVVMVTRGPGASNAMVGIHTAFQDSSPLVLLVGQVGTDMVEREAFQEIDYRRLYSECSKWVGSIDRVDRIDEFVSHAFHIAQSGRKGPVVLALPEDILYQCALEKPTAAAHIVQPGLDRTIFNDAMTAFVNASRPMILAGGGNWNASACSALSAWARREQLPLATSFRSQDLIDNQDACYAGDLGIGANPLLVKRIQEADVLLVIGERLGEMTTAGYSILSAPEAATKLIHVLSSPDELGRVYRPEFAINCSPENFCTALSDVRMGKQYDPEAMSSAHTQYLSFSAPINVKGDLQLAQIMASLPASIPRNAILTNGAGNFATWVHRFYPYGGFKSQLAPANGSMGYGLPAAIAAKIVDPSRVVIAVCGDGDFMMNCQELATASRYQAFPIILLVNNNMLGTIRMHQEREFSQRVIGTGLTNPDFIKFADSFGMPAYRVAKTEEFAPAFSKALDSKNGALIELVLDQEVISPSKLLSQLGK
ncbi:thiamine pyrophosphate-binding protein [Polynucleobacter sp. Latsch14-2]|jgi:acetolactate synthase-1/2/3 large subunit|uniref:thiamine pyrophosphate-binding protein n=1 Tax=Polynucleobacter sp. Latsch14-2 TaxID=2576920 RepID=UPI001C0E6AF8|nr:thiamine pyrophosphate-binding protein [Polynucleobacter sp. Latsch14-2]MBU3614289.1 thiamine pyrophosphate-binding protein [Polynucleobacter sp. Latsch14-2]